MGQQITKTTLYMVITSDPGDEMTDWASTHAEKRGLKQYRSFTTGKSPALGGIPHDVFGMTSLGVQEYVRGCLAAQGLQETEVPRPPPPQHLTRVCSKTQSRVFSSCPNMAYLAR
jgi:hypothetical protein